MVLKPVRGRIDPDVAAYARALLLDAYGPSAVKRMLEKRFPGDRTPSERWIKAERAKLKAEPSEPWDFRQAEPDEAAAVLPVLAAVIEHTLGKTRLVTMAEAAAIRRIRSAVPDIEAWDAYRLARQLLVADPEEADAATEAITWYLAFTPWRDGGARYARAYTEGWIDRQLYRFESEGEAAGAVRHEGKER